MAKNPLPFTRAYALRFSDGPALFYECRGDRVVGDSSIEVLGEYSTGVNEGARDLALLAELDDRFEGLIDRVVSAAFEAGMRAGKGRPVVLTRSPKGAKRRKPPRM